MGRIYCRNIATVASILIATINISYANCGADLDNKVQRLLDIERITYQIPGVQVSIFCPGEKNAHDYASGSTTLDQTTQLTAQNLFQIGSETKSFIAVIILELELEKRLHLEDPISKWLPTIPAAWRDITIKQLLNHTSGIYNYTDILDQIIRNDKNYDFKKDYSSQELIDLVKDKNLYFQPGAGWHYSNSNYVLAGMIIEAVTKHTVNEAITWRITEQIGLQNTYYLPGLYSDTIMKNMAHGYTEIGYFPDEPHDITDLNHSWTNAAGGIVATSHDTAVWFRKLLHNMLLPGPQMQELTTLVSQITGQPITAKDNEPGYGLGLMHDYATFNEEAWWHTGGTLGYSALMVWLKQSNIVITVNVNHLTTAIPSQRDTYVLTQHLAKIIRE